MNVRLTWVLTAVAAALSGMIFSFWPPALASLHAEAAEVARVDWTSHRSTSTELRLASGRTLQLACGFARACRSEEMQGLAASRSIVRVWHDGQRVYQVASASGTVLPYRGAYRGLTIVAVLLGFVLVALAVRVGVHAGWVQIPRRNG